MYKAKVCLLKPTIWNIPNQIPISITPPSPPPLTKGAGRSGESRPSDKGGGRTFRPWDKGGSGLKITGRRPLPWTWHWVVYGSVNSQRAHPPGIWQAFVILFWKSCKCPMVGLKSRVQMPHPGTTPKLNFSVNKLQIPYLSEISKNLIKKHEVPCASRS